jgi:hypothetical protein
MKTSMRKTGNFIRNNQRLLAVSLLMASIVSCKKGVMEPSVETYDDSNLDASVSTKATGNLIWSDNIDGSTFFSTGVSKQTSTSYGITAVSNPLYQGIKSARFELRDSDPETNNGTRAEISFPDATNLNRWYSYALYAPSAYFKYDSDDDVITQWHQGGGLTPALCLRVKADRLYLRVLGTWVDMGAFEKDVWRAYVMHVKHSAGSDGLIEIWRDGVKIMNRSGANAYKIEGDIEMPNLKLGVYKSDWNGSGTTQTNVRVLYFDDIRIGNEYATYADMTPTQGSTTPTTPTAPTDGSGDNSTTTPTSPTTGLAVTDFKLVNSATEQEVMSITNGQTISLSTLKLTKANIRAVTTTDASSVKFALSGKQSKSYTDNSSPYALHGDDGDGNYYYGNWNPPAVGTYTLTATPYTKDGASGTAGTAKTITFTIVN